MTPFEQIEKSATPPAAPAAAREPRSAVLSVTRRYYCVWGFYAFAPSFIFAIYPLFLRSRGLNQFQVNTVAGTYFLVTFLTDVPTGAFADAIGRRVSVVLGCALHAGAAGPVYQSWFNEQIDGDNRATLLSFGNTFATFGATAGLPVQGLIVDAAGVGAAWQGAGLLAMLQAPVYLALGRKAVADSPPL
jgi:MFS family permease